jgi:cation:H+ antiporter
MVLAPAITLAAGAVAIADQVVTRFEGLTLVVIYAGYVSVVVRDSRLATARGESIVHEGEEGPKIPPVAAMVGGLILVYVGATVMVEGGTRILARTGLSAGFVGAAIIGALASADEVLLEVMPVLRGMPELATGNLFGTVAAFSTVVLGLASLVRPLEVDSAASSAFIAAAVLYTLVAMVFASRGRAGRLTGVLVLLGYGAWLLLAARI